MVIPQNMVEGFDPYMVMCLLLQILWLFLSKPWCPRGTQTAPPNGIKWLVNPTYGNNGVFTHPLMAIGCMVIVDFPIENCDFL